MGALSKMEQRVFLSGILLGGTKSDFFNVIGGDYNDYEFNFEYHGRKFSIDLSYLRATSLNGDIKYGNVDHLDEEGLRMNVVNERASVVYHFSPRYNIGASLIMSNSIYNNDDIKINQNKWLARAFLGVRL